MRHPTDPPRITAEHVREIVAILDRNAATIDEVLPADREHGSIWYARARAEIVAEATAAGAPINRVARVLAHLSIGTRWELQVESFPHVARIVAYADQLHPDIVANLLMPWTFYNHVAEFAAQFAYRDEPVLDTPKKTHQFYGALMIPENPEWYVSDTHDLQLRGMLTPDDAGILGLHPRLEDVMSSIMIYRALLAAARATLAEPCARQAERWVFYRDNRAALKAGRHPFLRAEIIPCPISHAPMILWQKR